MHLLRISLVSLLRSLLLAAVDRISSPLSVTLTERVILLGSGLTSTVIRIRTRVFSGEIWSVVRRSFTPWLLRTSVRNFWRLLRKGRPATQQRLLLRLTLLPERLSTRLFVISRTARLHSELTPSST